MFLNNLALLIVLAPSPAFATLVQDGSFEQLPPQLGYDTGSMGAWTVEVKGNQVAAYAAGSAGWNVTDGNQACDLGMGGYASGNSISQVLPTTAGQAYRLSFDWGSEYAMGTSGFVSVGRLNQPLVEPDRSDSDTTWIVNSASFVFVASGNDTLTFGEPAEPLDLWGLVLDNIRVVQIAPPQLTLALSGTNVILTWPSDATGFVLESASTLADGGDWQDFPTAPTEIDGQNVVTITATGPGSFFRLHQP